MPPATEGELLSIVTRMENRVSSLEARSEEQIKALKTDTESIRIQGHALANRLTEFTSHVIEGQTILKAHMAACEKRGAQQVWLARTIFLAVLAVLGFLIKIHFFPGVTL